MTDGNNVFVDNNADDEGTVGDDDDEQVRKSLVAEKAYNKALFTQTQLNYSSEATCTS